MSFNSGLFFSPHTPSPHHPAVHPCVSPCVPSTLPRSCSLSFLPCALPHFPEACHPYSPLHTEPDPARPHTHPPHTYTASIASCMQAQASRKRALRQVVCARAQGVHFRSNKGRGVLGVEGGETVMGKGERSVRVDRGNGKRTSRERGRGGRGGKRRCVRIRNTHTTARGSPGSTPHPRIILADRAGRYIPLIKEFPPDPDGQSTVPKLYWDAPAGTCPFINPHRMKFPPKGKSRSRRHPTLYCECCEMSFSTTIKRV